MRGTTNTEMIAAAIDYYDRDASRFAARYETVSFLEVHGHLLDRLPMPGSRILDVGAGSGRDARALAAMGYAVTAVEPAGDLRRMASARSGGEKVRWIDDQLPALATLEAERFAFILCSAVLMLLPDSAMTQSLVRMASLLEPNGYLALSIRDAVAGEPPELVHIHDATTITRAAQAAGLVLVEDLEMADALGRAGRAWRQYLLIRADS